MIITGAPLPTVAQFERIRRLVHDACGIHLHAGKETLVQARLARRLRALGMSGFDAYLDHVQAPGSGELAAMLDVLTTNKTSFFREAAHFDYLAQVLPAIQDASRRPLRLWSAGCSTGEEPYTMAMVLRETLGAQRVRDARILATDLSSEVLVRARAATYAEAVMADVPAPLRERYFERVDGVGSRVTADLGGMVRLARLNLQGAWPMRGPFDVIFCRNVMIYFDKATQERLVGRFAAMLRPGGLLFVGHSESLSGIRHELRYVAPAVYER